MDPTPTVAGVDLDRLPSFPEPGHRTLTVIMQKGGVGKTAVTVNLADALARSGVPVCVVDLCHTGMATKHLGLQRVTGPVNLASLMLGTIDVPAHELVVERSPNLYVIPSAIDMVTIGEELISKRFREERLRVALGDLSTRMVIIIDCPPVLDLRTDNALIACAKDDTDDIPAFGGTILVPELAEASLETMSLLLDQVNAINRNTRYTITHLGWLASIVDQTKVSNRARATLAKLPLTRLGELPRRTRVKEARDEGRTLYEHDPSLDLHVILADVARKLREMLHV